VHRRIRVFYVSYTPPLPTWGGAMAFYRHFVERVDFEIAVATNSSQFSLKSPPYPVTFFGPSPIVQRLFRTRFLPWLYGLHSLIAAGRIPKRVWRAAKEFKPDCIFTIAGSWDYSGLIAQRVARRLKVPLVASFNDWFDYGWFPVHPAFRPAIERRFRRFYREADLALCTSEGMREALGPHPNAHVLYPIGAALPSATAEFTPHRPQDGAAIVAFGGNLGEWYGGMMERLIQHSADDSNRVRFQIFGSKATWSKKFDEWARRAGVFHGQVPFDKLRHEMARADVLLLPMGFGESCAQVEHTSFKTKFLDYVSFQKPILVWGPDYCSAVRIAREFDSAECCTSADERACRAILEKLVNDPSRQLQLVTNARRMYEDRFNPDRIHNVLVQQFRTVISARHG